jgi:hypothetical protein
MIRFRPSFWPCLIVSCLLVFLYFRLPLPHKDIPAPLELSPLPLPEEFNVLHPGEFTDPATYPDVHIVLTPTDPSDEPEGEGTVNDVPYVTIAAADHSNKLAGSTDSTKEESSP